MNSLILLTLVFNILFLIFFKKISNLINIFDEPSTNIKIHNKKISAIGGLLFFITLSFYFILNNFSIDSNYLSLKENLFIFFFSIFFLLKGLYDDKYPVSANIKILISALFIIIFLIINENFVINNLKFSFTNQVLYLKDFNIIFTTICILLFMNACNMFDGVNLQFVFYILILSIIFLSKLFLTQLFIVIIISCIFFIYLNYKNQLFIGNNGTLFFGFFYSILFIETYNITFKIQTVDEIFLYMSIIGFDLIRTTFSRVIKGKNIFYGDKNHIHHLLIKKHSLITSVLLIQTAIIVPIIYASLTSDYLYGCLISFILYMLLLLYCKKNR
jgi:UDP-GlcNAc:undecaprenyl-phosphate GlcNAc-1-phosphate transferase